MAWSNSPTKVGLDFLAEMFGARPNVTRVAFGTSTIAAGDLFSLTDVVDWLKDGSIISCKPNGATTSIQARVDNQGIDVETQIASVFVFADNGDGTDVLILVYTTTRPIPVDTEDELPGWEYEPQLNLTFSNGTLVTATIDWDAYAKMRDVQTAVDSAIQGLVVPEFDDYKDEVNGRIEAIREDVEQFKTDMQLDLNGKENLLSGASVKPSITDGDFFYIRDSDDANQSKAVSWGDTINKIMDDLAPILGLDVPTNFAIARGNQQLVVSFNHASSASNVGTRVVYKTSGFPTSPTDGTGVNVTGTSGTAGTTTLTGLTNGTMYYIALFAYDSVPNYSSAITNSAAPIADVGTITNFTATAGNQQISLSWTNPGGSFANVTIIRKTGSYPSSITDGTAVVSASTGTSAVDTGLTSGTAYYYRAFPSNGVNYNTTTTGQQVTATPISYSTTFGSNAISVIQNISENDIAVNNLTAAQVYSKYGWSVGDTITPTGGSNAGIAIPHRIIGFNSRTLTTVVGSRTKAGIELQPVDCYGTTTSDRKYMNSSNTNTGSWDASYMRGTVMPLFKGYFAAAWQSAMKAVNIITAATYNGASNQTTSDTMYLLAAKEIFGGTASAAGAGTSYSNLTEFNALTQSAWYAANNTADKRVKKQPANGSACYWWERSPYYSAATNFCIVNSSGGANDNYASNTIGVAPCFCI